MNSRILRTLVAAVGLPATLLADVVLFNEQTLLLDGATVTEETLLSENEPNFDSLRARKGHSSVEGNVQFVGNLIRIRVEPQASLTIEGPMEGSSYLVLNAQAPDSVLTIKGHYTNKPDRFTDQEGQGTVIFSSSDNLVGEYRLRQGTLQTEVANAFDPVSTVIRMGGDNEFSAMTDAVLDLNGCNLEIAGLTEIKSPLNTRSITSDRPAQLAISAENKGSSFSGTLSGSLSLLKKGSRSLVLQGEHLYTGPTIVEDGALELAEAKLAGSGGTQVLKQGILKGAASVGGETIVEGTLAPTGQLHLEHLNMKEDSVLLWTQGASNDEAAIEVAGTLNLRPPVYLRLSFPEGTHQWNDATWSQPQRWIIARASQGISNGDALKISAERWLDSSGKALTAIRPKGNFSLKRTNNQIELVYQP